MSETEYTRKTEHVVMNRDIPPLTQIFYTMQDIISLERRSDWQRERMYSVTRQLRSMPGGGGLPSGLDKTIAELEELNHDYGERLQQYVHELKTAERILNAIESRTLRTFVQMFYVDNIKKAEIMRELDMSEYAFERARTSVERAPDMAHVRWHERYLTRDE